MSSAETVLITGGSGMVGTRLSQLLMEAGYAVIHLGRKKARKGAIVTYQWDIKNRTIEVEALLRADHIVHLAGANVAEGRWTPERKKEIVSSRVETASLLIEQLKELNRVPQSWVSASAVGYYGDTGNDLVDENSPKGTGFLADVCQQWEDAVKPVEQLGSRLVINRIGIVMSSQGGALPKTAQTLKFGLGATLGDGKQIVPWIHIDDLCRQFVCGIKNEKLRGVYNAVAPLPVTNKELTETIAEAQDKKVIIAPAPAFVLKLALGEMAEAVLSGQRVSSKKIQEAGFTYQHPQLFTALKDLYERNV